MKVKIPNGSDSTRSFSKKCKVNTLRERKIKRITKNKNRPSVYLSRWIGRQGTENKGGYKKN